MSRHALFPAALMFSVALGACAMSNQPNSSSATALPNDIPTNGQSDATACDPGKAQWTLGQAASESVLNKARDDAGAKYARVLKPGQMVTMEFNATRLNLRVDDKNLVTSATCG